MKSFDVLLWVAVSLFTLFLIALPTGATAQYLFAVVAIGSILAIHFIGPSPFFRQIFIIVAFALTLKYVYWRTTTTIPPYDAPLDFTAALIVLAAELYCITMLFMSVFVMIDPIRARPTPPLPRDLPTVDVFVPSYNEDVSLVACTLAAAKAMIYDPDKLTVHLLDDGATEQKLNSQDPIAAEAAAARRDAMRAVCDELGVVYHARERNEMAKAGNLNHGLAHTSGELIVVLDADHAPTRTFLTETVGHFAQDDRLFLVQTPHVFLNPDPIERNLGIAGYAPSENEMFYGQVQRGLDSWNASFFCGSAAVLRRAALEEVNGFSGRSITEDCETALELHARGWNSRYVETPLIRGLQPETFATFIGQRSRWCQGMIQIFLLKSPWFTPGLGLKQRIAYSSSCMFWFFPIVRWIFLIAPLLYLLFDMKIYAASVEEFVVYTIPYLIAAVLLQGFLFGKYRWPWISELYEFVQSIYLARAVISVVFNPTSPKFNVTDKGVTLETSKLSPLALPYFLVFAVLLGAAIYGGYRLSTEPASQTLLLVVGGWNLFNLILAGLALGCVCERRERRRHPRRALERLAQLAIDGESTPVRLASASQGGITFRFAGRGASALAIGATGELTMTGIDGQERSVNIAVANRDSAGGEARYGATFDEADMRRFGVIADLMYAGSAQASLPIEAERRSRNVLIWTAELIARAVAQASRGFGFAVLRVLRPGRAATSA